MQAGARNTIGIANVFIGTSAGSNNEDGDNNVALGFQSANGDTAMTNSIYIGYRSGYTVDSEFTSRSGNVFIGHEAGNGKLNSDQLYIENSDANKDSALIYGRFDTDQLTFNANVGIGTITPSHDLHIREESGNGELAIDGSDLSTIWFKRSSGNRWAFFRTGTAEAGSNAGSDLQLNRFNDSGNFLGTAVFIERSSGHVGIGTNNPNATSRLHVTDGDIRIENGSFVDDGTTLNVPDYVFVEDYNLNSLEEVEHYIETPQHLPGIPSMNDIEGWSGLSLQDRDMKLLEKVEELFLHTIQMGKTIHQQNKLIQSLQKELEGLKGGKE